MLEVLSLSCERGDRQLFDEVSFALQPGSLLHVLGRNGSGKTTLLRTLCGLFFASAGEIRWNGRPVAEQGEEYRKDLLYLGHLNGIKLDLTAEENLHIAAALDADDAAPAAIGEALRQIGLAGFEDLPAKVLSQGQKRRVALARLLLSSARIWVLDEPFTALDVAAVEQLQQIIAAFVQRGGIVILTTHQEVPLTSGQIQRLHLAA
ncbi:MAG: cytochrome c biogenesis heme-transporting ATPase CcmA [Thiotrichales bacterium]